MLEFHVYLKRATERRIDVMANDSTDAAEKAVAYAKSRGWSARKVLRVEQLVWRAVVIHYPATDEYED